MSANYPAGGIDNRIDSPESATRVHVPTIAWVAVIVILALVLYKLWRKG